ncbi:MAG: DNA repair exonuclease [Bacillota bacterium]
MPLKLLHTADFHLGMTFNNRPYPKDVRKQLVEARFEALARAVEIANNEKCVLLVIAGDLFHRANVAAESVVRAVDILKRFEGVTAVLPGNHDYFEPYSTLWALFRDEAFDELVLLTERKHYKLHDYGIEAVLYPAPCDSKHSAENRLGWMKELAGKSEALWHIGVAHGTVRGVSPDFAEQYFPMEESELAALKMDHWCLGHTHVCYPDLPETGREPFLYSGTPEPDGFDCRHRGTVWITELDDDGIQYSRKVETGQFRFREIEREIRSSGDFEKMHKELAEEGSKTLVKLKLCGSLPESEYRERHAFYDRLGEMLLYLEWDDSELTVEITPEVIDSKYPSGSFPHKFLRRMAEKGNPEALQAAYRLIEGVRE